MDVIHLVSKGFELGYKKYQASLFKNKIEIWQARIQDSLNEALAVQEFLEDDELKTLRGQVDVVLRYTNVLLARSSNKSSWFHSHEESKALDTKSRKVLEFSRSMSSVAKLRMLDPEYKKVNKEALLGRLRERSQINDSAARSIQHITDVSNALADSVLVGTSVQSSEVPHGLNEVTECEARRQLAAAMRAAEASTSMSANADETLRTELEVQAIVCMTRAMQAGARCTCPQNHFDQNDQCLN